MRCQNEGLASSRATRELLLLRGGGVGSPGVTASTVLRQAFFVPRATLLAPSVMGLNGDGLGGSGVGSTHVLRGGSAAASFLANGLVGAFGFAKRGQLTLLFDDLSIQFSSFGVGGATAGAGDCCAGGTGVVSAPPGGVLRAALGGACSGGGGATATFFCPKGHQREPVDSSARMDGEQHVNRTMPPNAHAMDRMAFAPPCAQT